MTYARREEIFSKDVLSVKELQEILALPSPKMASKTLCAIKRELQYGRKQMPRDVGKGKLHVEDYLDYFNIKADRYKKTTIL